ncbi:MAG: M28 family peptidase [Rubripirellula sp.]
MLKLSEADAESARQNTRAWSHQSTVSSDPVPPRPSSSGRWIGISFVVAICGVLAWFLLGAGNDTPVDVSPTSGAIPSAYQPDRAMGYLQKLCEFGSRPSGSAAMTSQQQYLQAFFAEQGAVVSMQTFDIRHPEDGSNVSMSNVIASWGLDRPKRFLLCAHYDTRPFPDQDRSNRRGVFLGANDGASGTAALMEISHQFASNLPSDVGVDIVLFDGEEFVFQQGRDDYFLGSTFFAEKYKSSPPAIPYQAGILLDMIGDRELKIFYEVNSLRMARDVTKSVWAVASDLGVDAFVARTRHEIQDDHLPLNRIAGIPTTDIIDFDYPRPGIGAPSYWHTQQDVPANCSGTSMAAVVWVVHVWLTGQ